ncbi:hypothetical protein [Methanolacinia petrolearia]|uniref:hypothetical protein n=1 Tax=Methanolacinia petrolearia TaxID=54120 RepID=UPI003BAA649D
MKRRKAGNHSKNGFPVGYDTYILEVTFPYSPPGSTFIDLFENVNEIVSYDLKGRWEDYLRQQVGEQLGSLYDSSGHFLNFFRLFNDRNVRKVLTKTKEKIDGPFVDEFFNLGNPEDFVFNNIQPRYFFPKSKKRAIAVGAFPAEYWDIYPDLKWYGFDYAGFMERFRKENYDLAVIGACTSWNLKFHDRPARPDIICYQPSVYNNLRESAFNHGGVEDHRKVMDDFMEVYRKIKNEPVGTRLGKEGGIFAGYNNKYWIYLTHPDFDLIKKEENILLCNGWVLPQYLIRDGFLEVE